MNGLPAPAGRAYALELPKGLMSDKFEFVDFGGIPWVFNRTTGLLCPLESICEKVRIPGVKYGDSG